MKDLPKPTKGAIKPPKDPTAASRTWAIALIVSAILLLAAVGVVIWLVVTRGLGGVNTASQAPTDPSVGVKNVTFVLPADMPAPYVKRDQSRVGESVVFYDDEGSVCSVMLSVLPVDAAKTPQQQVFDRLAAAYAKGVDTTNTKVGERYVVKDADGTHEYSFESVVTGQSLNINAVGHVARQQVTLFKKFGNQVVAIGYGCKTETWLAKQTELAALVGGITLKTER
ncbi:MAG TPA: hypothetical protein VM581_05160 [Magnetospirillaceae bacterium]|nr:hypothetical protein [Magnetospirillaceae bacterium]